MSDDEPDVRQMAGDFTASDEVAPPAAPIAEEWEPFLRAPRSTDDTPIVLTERQVARIQWIATAALDVDSPDHAAALDQLADVRAYLGALMIETSRGDGLIFPPSAEVWARLDEKPYYLQGSHHARKVDDLRRQGLDPYGRPLGGTQTDEA